MKYLFIALVLMASNAAHCAERCSSSEAKVAEEAADTMRTWPALYAGFKKYGNCDDGSIAEGFDDDVVHLLATDWGSLETAAIIFAKDIAFRKFALRHITATADTDELRHIDTFAVSRCPANLIALCKDIQASAAAAVSEAEQFDPADVPSGRR
jgi:hypothetical protein